MSADYRTLPLAVVGMGCRFPGTDDLDAFWKLLHDGRHGIAEFPPERLDQRLYYNPDREAAETSYSRIAGIVPPRPIDPSICPIPDDVAAQFDDVHRTMCEVACAALHDAGYHPHKLPPSQTGVYIGNCTGSNLEADLVYRSHTAELAELLRDSSGTELDEDAKTRAAEHLANAIRQKYPSWEDSTVREVTAAAAARLISSTLSLTGPSLAVDAACISSFMGLHLAGMALQRGRIDAAVVGAFSYRNWWEMVLLSPTQTISPDGSCPFSEAAGGMVPADGYAAVVVKTLPRAIADGDQVYGVVGALGLSSDGRGKGFWAPRQEGQVAAVHRAYEHGIDPARLQYVEAHATSTQLGDTTEMATLDESLGGMVQGSIPVGSVKSNIGHTLEVAGLAGLIKTLLAMKHGIVPASVHCEPLNPAIDWAESAFRVPARAEEWPQPADGTPRRAGIDSFGIGGLNVHVVVDEGPADSESSGRAAAAALVEDIAVIGVSMPVANAEIARGMLQLADVPNVEADAAAADYAFDWKKHRIPPKEVANANPLQFLLLDAAVRALEHAGFPEREFDRSRTGTVVGTPFTSDFSCDALVGVRLPEIRETVADALKSQGATAEQIARVTTTFDDALLKSKPARHDLTGSLSSSTLSSRISKHLDVMGGAVSIDAGPQSPHQALIAAVDLLHSGTNDLVICACGQNRNDVAFRDQLAAGKGYDGATEAGFLGTGAAAVVLKRVSDAQRDGDTILSVLPADLPQRLAEASASTSKVTTTIDNAPTSGTNRSDIESEPKNLPVDEMQRSVIASVVERTALPPELVTLDSRLRDDLGLDRSTTEGLFREFSVAEHLNPITVREFVAAAGNGESATPVAIALPAPVVAETLKPFVYRMLECPAGAAADPVALGASALVVGNNAAATALSERLLSMDIPVINLSVDDATAVDAFEQIWLDRRPTHLFLLTSRDGDSRPLPDALWPVEICERWWNHIAEDDRADVASVVVVTNLGGDFGLRRSIDEKRAVVDGALRGMLHTRDPRMNHLTVRIIDTPENEPPKMIAAAACRELGLANGTVESATVRGKRYIMSTVPAVAPFESPKAQAAGGQWVVLGSDSDFIAVVAQAAQQSCEARVNEITGLTGDALADRLAEIRAAGPIRSVISLPIETQPGDDLTRAVQQRVEDANELLTLTASDPLERFLFVERPRSETGNNRGNAAREALAQWLAAAARGRDQLRAVLLDCEADSPAQLAAAVVAEIQQPLPESRVLLAEASPSDDLHTRLVPHLQQAPLIDSCFAGATGGIAEIAFDPTTDPFLAGHLDHGIPLLPAVAGIETCAQAACVWSGGRSVVSLRNQQIQNGFRMARPARHHARVLLDGTDNEITCQLVGDFYDKHGTLTDPYRQYQSCVLDLAGAPREITRPDLGPSPTGEWSEVPYPEDWRDMGAAESGTVFYGPELRTLKHVHHRPEGSWGKMIAPPTAELGGSRRGSRWHTPASLLDGALFLCDLHATHNFGTRQLPHVIDRIDFGRLPNAGEDCLCRVLFRERDGRRITWDFWIVGADGSVILATQGFHVVTLR